MPEFPETSLPNLPVVSTHSEECMGSLLRYFVWGAAGNAAWQTANFALFYPWRVESPLTIVKGLTINGSTASGNIDIGVYDSEFNRIVSAGGAAQAGTSTIQEFDITDTDIMPGQYWMAIALSSTSGTMIRTIAGTDEISLAGAPILGMAAAYPLPSVATPTLTSTSNPPIPLFGFTTQTLV